MSMAKELGDGVVEQTTEAAFKLMPDITAAMKKLTELKGCGPATASGVCPSLLVSTSHAR